MTPTEALKAGTDLARRTRKAQQLPRTVRNRDAVRRVVALLVTRKAAP